MVCWTLPRLLGRVTWLLKRLFKIACEQALRGALAAGQEKEGELARGGGGGGVLLGILGGVVPPGSSNPDPISDQKMYFSTPVFRPDL